MSNNETVASLDEFEAVFKLLVELQHCELEWYFAIRSGWDNVEYERLYVEYVESTQRSLNPTDDAIELKARPMERVARYFLEKGGVVRSINEISEPQRWQVDGQGPLNNTAIAICWGEEICRKCGFQLYMEAKNHSDPVTNEEFSVHFRRMEEHDCYVGVMVSTSGYRIWRGRGIAESLHRNYYRDRFHLLLVFQSLQAVVVEGKAPLAILQEVLCFVVNNSYANDPEVQDMYSLTTCHEAARSEYQRLNLNSNA